MEEFELEEWMKDRSRHDYSMVFVAEMKVNTEYFVDRFAIHQTQGGRYEVLGRSGYDGFARTLVDDLDEAVDTMLRWAEDSFKRLGL
jgi:hypothetical protein